MPLSARWLQFLVLAFLVTAVWLGTGPWRQWVLRHPRWILAGLVGADAALLLWATTPFVPSGIDESQFLMNAQHLRGADVPVSFMRTSLPVLAIAPFAACPALPGILARQLATLLAYALARPALGTGFALVAALLTGVAAELERNTLQVLSEPYGAAALASFALAAAGMGPVALFATATLGFLSRWQLLWLLPVAAYLAVRRRGWWWATVGTLLATGVVLGANALTGADPWRAFVRERLREHTLVERLRFYLAPQTGLGLGVLAMLLAAVGVAWMLRTRPREPRLLACAMVFAVYAAGVVTVGVLTPRFLAPAVPLGCVLAAAGVRAVVQRWPAIARGWRGGALLAALVAITAIPVRAPRSREQNLASPSAALVAGRDPVLAALGAAPLFTDVDVYLVTAILGRRCHAVLGPLASHPEGMSPDFEGEVPAVSRAALASGSYYLTFDPADRAPLWRGGPLALVRW